MGLVAIDPFAVAIAARSPSVESFAVIFGQEQAFDMGIKTGDNRRCVGWTISNAALELQWQSMGNSSR